MQGSFRSCVSYGSYDVVYKFDFAEHYHMFSSWTALRALTMFMNYIIPFVRLSFEQDRGV